MPTVSRLTPTLEDVGELTDPPQQLPVGDRQLISRLVTFPATDTHDQSSNHSVT